jgi:hypothetical protein
MRYIRPATAADVAKEFGIKVCRSGLEVMDRRFRRCGKKPMDYMFGLTNVEIDEALK